MPSLRVLTVDLADLNLETDVINGAKVEISIERTTTFDSFVIAPSLDYKATSDETGILTFNILPSDANTVYRASVIDASGKQVLSSVFVMPDSNASLAELLELSFFPDGFNSTPNIEASFIQFKSNGTNLGTPQTVRNFNMAQDGLLTFDLETFTVTLDLASINTAIAGKEPSIAAGTSLQFWRGDKTWQTLDTSVVPATTDKRYVTDSQLVVIGNTSGTNTGDETDTSIRTKIGAASASNDGYLSQADWQTFNPKSSTWALFDASDSSKRVNYNVSGITTGTTRTLTIPDANVNLGYVPSALSVSGGIMTLTGVGGQTLTANISDMVPITTSAGMNLVAGKTYQLSNDTTNYTINLPSSPSDGDCVTILDTPAHQESRVGRAGVITLSAGSNWFGVSGLVHSIDICGPATFGAKRFYNKYYFRASDSTWQSQGFVTDKTTVNGYTVFYAVGSPVSGGVPTHHFQFDLSGLTGGRTVTVPDKNVDLTYVNGVPYNNNLYNNSTGGSQSAIVAGTYNNTTKQAQCVITGRKVNQDGLCPEDAWIYGNLDTSTISAKVTGTGNCLKAQSTGTASATLVTGSNTKPPAYLTKPSGHHAVSIYELAMTHTSSAGKVWFGRRRVCVRWDGSSATTDVQTIGTDWNPDTQTVTLTPTVSSGLLLLDMANATAGGGDTCHWQCTYTSHHNGG